MKRVLLCLGAWAALAGVAAAEPAFDADAATAAWMATMGPEATARSNSYFEGGYWIQYVASLITIGICALLLVTGWASGLRTFVERVLRFKTLAAWGMALVVLIWLTVLSFPFDSWVLFVREHQYGLSTQTFAEWLSDYAKNVGIDLFIVPIFIAILYLVVRATKDAWWIWASGVTAAFFAVIIAAAPVFIEPMFNTYTPMQTGALKESILSMAQANGVPADDVLVFDESKQSNRVTANVAGLGDTMRVALADNLLTRVSPDGVRAVMGHELGHYVLGHIMSLIFMLSVLAAVLYACVHYSFRAIAKNERWGIRDVTDPAGLPLAIALFVAFATLAIPVNNNIIRFHEHQADIFGLNAARAPDGFAETALLLSEYRKMAPSPLEEWFFYDHPSGYARIHMAMAWKANEMAAGRYPQGPGGPPEGYRPDFVVGKDAPSPEPSPAAPSD